MDTRIADKAKMLRRELGASIEDRLPSIALDDMTTWAGKLAAGFPKTEPAMREIVDLRADATPKMRKAVAEARDHFYAAADVINRLFRGGGLSINDDNRNDVASKLAKAYERMRKCLVVLAWIDGEKN